jgi:hypothetical protein
VGEPIIYSIALFGAKGYLENWKKHVVIRRKTVYNKDISEEDYMEKERQDIEQLLQEGNSIQIKPQGYSMYPVLVPGRDEAVIEPLKDRKLKRGDVALYRRIEEHSTGILVLHRVWKVSSEGIYMVGDNQKEVEGPLASEQFLGIMVGMYRKGKYISCSNLCYRFLTGTWLCLRPFRMGIARTAAKIKSCFLRKK